MQAIMKMFTVMAIATRLIDFQPCKVVLSL
jgi:hypothetical protein